MSFPLSLRALVVSSLVFAGCDPKPEPTGEPPPTDTAPPNQVSGSLLLRYRTDQGDASVPQVVAASDLQAFAFEEDGLRPLGVVMAPEGSFTVPEAPAGKYMLRLGKRYLVTDARQVNLDTYALGRRDTSTVDALPETLASFSNFAPQTADSYPLMNAVSVRAGTSASLFLEQDLPAGATSISRAKAKYDQYEPQSPTLLNAAKGDSLVVTSLRERVNEAFSYQGVDRFLSQGVSMDPVRPTELQGTFQEVPQKTLTLDWRAADFDAYTTQVYPGATTGTRSFAICPTEGTDAWYGYLGELMATDPVRKVPTQSIAFTYGNPFPARWGEVISFSHYARVNLRLPGTSLGGVSLVGLRDVRPLAEAAPGPFTVRISPPQAFTVEGQDAHPSSPLGSLTPRLAWKAPQLGTPSAYRVSVNRLYAREDQSLRSLEASFTTTDTSLRLPPGILQAGQTYYFTVTSHLTPGVELATDMHRLSVLTNAASADVVSGLFTTPASVGAGSLRQAAPRASEPDALERLELARSRHARAP